MYEHLVLSSGGVDGIINMGAIISLIQMKALDMKNIKTIHAVSAGALIGVLLLLDYDVEYLMDYIIKRPWQKTFSVDGVNLSNLLKKKGLFDSTQIHEILRPLIEAKDISSDVTLKEFYALTNVELFMYSTNLNKYPLELVELSYKSHPDMCLRLALQMTCCYPVIFTPLFVDDACFVDGGLITKCPTNYCVEYLKRNYWSKETGVSLDDLYKKILVFKSESSLDHVTITDDSSLIQYLRHMIQHMNFSIVNAVDTLQLPNTVLSFNTDTDLTDAWYGCITSAKKRESYLKMGKRFGHLYLKMHNSQEKH